MCVGPSGCVCVCVCVCINALLPKLKPKVAPRHLLCAIFKYGVESILPPHHPSVRTSWLGCHCTACVSPCLCDITVTVSHCESGLTLFASFLFPTRHGQEGRSEADARVVQAGAGEKRPGPLWVRTHDIVSTLLDCWWVSGVIFPLCIASFLPSSFTSRFFFLYIYIHHVYKSAPLHHHLDNSLTCMLVCINVHKANNNLSDELLFFSPFDQLLHNMQLKLHTSAPSAPNHYAYKQIFKVNRFWN